MAYKPQERTAEQAYQTTDNLGAGEIYDSGIVDLRGWTQVDTRIVSDQDGLIRISWYSDEAGADQVRLLTIPYSASNGFQLFSAPAFTPFNRYEFINGGVGQGDFFFETKLLHTALSPQILGLTAFIADGMVAQLNRSINTGQQPDGDYVNARSDGTAFSNLGPLAGGEVFQSDWIDTDGFVSIELFIAANEFSANNGIVIQYTDDVQGGAVVRATDRFTYTQADIDRGYLAINFSTRLDGFRVGYENGSSPTAFFIQADLRTNSSPLRTDRSGSLIVGAFEDEVALGNIPNYQNGTKFGSVLDISNTDIPVTVWRAADSGSAFARKTFQATAANAWVCGTGAGTQEITLIVNNASNELEAVTLNLNGTTPVDTGVSVLDCNTAFVSGPDETLGGDVWITNANNFTGLGVPNDPTEVLALIPEEDQRTQQATYRVPIDTKMIIKSLHAASSISVGQGRVAVKLRIKPENGSWYTFRPYILSTSFLVERKELMTFSAGTLIEFFLNDSDNGTDTTVIFSYDLIKEV